jgi:hypothetical protein
LIGPIVLGVLQVSTPRQKCMIGQTTHLMTREQKRKRKIPDPLISLGHASHDLKTSHFGPSLFLGRTHLLKVSSPSSSSTLENSPHCMDLWGTLATQTAAVSLILMWLLAAIPVHQPPHNVQQHRCDVKTQTTSVLSAFPLISSNI